MPRRYLGGSVVVYPTGLPSLRHHTCGVLFVLSNKLCTRLSRYNSPNMVKGQRTSSYPKNSAPGSISGRKKPPASTTSSDKTCNKTQDLPACSGCGIIIGTDTKALQCDKCSSEDSWKCIECLDMQPSTYDFLISGHGCELRWFCKSCDDMIMGQTDKLHDIMQVLSALMTKTDRIESALSEKVDKCFVKDMESRIANVEESAGKLIETNQKLRTDFEKTVEGIQHSNQRLGEVIQSSIEEKVGDLVNTVNKQKSIDSHFIHDCVQGAVNVKLQEDHKEQEKMKRRKNNEILHGLQKPAAADPEERKTEDELQIMSLLHDIDCDDISVDSVIRLGRIPEADDEKPRPILLRFPS